MGTLRRPANLLNQHKMMMVLMRQLRLHHLKGTFLIPDLLVNVNGQGMSK